MDNPKAERTFIGQSDCATFLAEQLEGGTDPIDKACLSAFVDLCEDPASGLEMRVGRWVVKFEDIGVFSAVRNAFISLGAAGYAFQNLEQGGVAAVFFAVTEIFVNTYRSLGKLTSRQGRIIAIMERAGKPVSAAMIVRQPTEAGDLDWNEKTIENELKSLEHVPIRKGSMKAVERQPDGRWRLNGI